MTTHNVIETTSIGEVTLNNLSAHIITYNMSLHSITNISHGAEQGGIMRVKKHARAALLIQRPQPETSDSNYPKLNNDYLIISQYPVADTT